MISDISVITPTFNEEKQIPALAGLAEHVRELIIVDGGSQDKTAEEARNAGLMVVSCSPGRGGQLNLGAQRASTNILLFLHADTRLPDNFQSMITDCLCDPEVICGAFSLKIADSTPLLKLIAGGANLRSRLLSLPYGDQALFIRKDRFFDLGGFPDISVMEDFAFIRRAGKKGRVEILDAYVTTSARRWQKMGALRTTLINQLMIIGYFLGISPEKLERFYRQKR
ncbi:MAG: TIGR04283 family arsenosugar biosynthesis glycosyltransferase [Thermodesulfobacteriota bacterium]